MANDDDGSKAWIHWALYMNEAPFQAPLRTPSGKQNHYDYCVIEKRVKAMRPYRTVGRPGGLWVWKRDIKGPEERQ